VIDRSVLKRATRPLPLTWRSLALEHSHDGDLPGARAPTAHAGVLIALEPDAGDFWLYLTQRTMKLKHHAGQISFPGGRVDASDTDPIAAALREAHEEIGLNPALLDVLGVLEPYDTITGFRVTPVVALLTAPFKPVAAPDEVDSVFRVPLQFLRTPGSLEERHAPYLGADRRYYGYQFGERWIWGATAGMLRSFCLRLNADVALNHPSSAALAAP
jgi:8-oxo-dGTP pyrophosphatase MutT (NUDIX family)